MNKTFRQGQILKLIRAKRILTQEDLARELKESTGIQATQVTLSRDIRDLGLLKTPQGYQKVSEVPGGAGGPGLETAVSESRRTVKNTDVSQRVGGSEPPAPTTRSAWSDAIASPGPLPHCGGRCTRRCSGAASILRATRGR